jgi:hypothetical protein
MATHPLILNYINGYRRKDYGKPGRASQEGIMAHCAAPFCYAHSPKDYRSNGRANGGRDAGSSRESQAAMQGCGHAKEGHIRIFILLLRQ